MGGEEREKRIRREKVERDGVRLRKGERRRERRQGNE